jgi:Ca2+/Na+ antiporter
MTMSLEKLRKHMKRPIYMMFGFFFLLIALVSLGDPSGVTLFFGAIGAYLVYRARASKEASVPDETDEARKVKAAYRVFEAHANEVFVLVTLARTDSRLTAEVRELISTLLTSAAREDVDRATLDSLIKDLRTPESGFREAVKAMKQLPRERQKLLWQYIDKVAKGREDDLLCSAKLRMLQTEMPRA